MQMAMRINVTTTPTRTPSTGVICTRTARDDAENSKNIIFTFKVFNCLFLEYATGPRFVMKKYFDWILVLVVDNESSFRLKVDFPVE
jgi:hypothetical protein